MSGPLSDITILDVSRILSGPFCTMLLRDLGARVIKIERPGQGDIARHMGPKIGEKSSDSAYFTSVNRGKESIGLDIFSEPGQKLFKQLISEVDILVENYVPGTMARYGLGYDQIKGLNPQLIYASISGYGQTGPYANLPALDIIVQAMGGLMGITGEPDGPPIRPGASLADSTAGLFTATAILAALHQRGNNGKGQHIDSAMLDCQITLMENAFSRYFATGEAPSRLGSRHPAATPFQAFQTADNYIVVALLTNEESSWQRFCEVIGLPDLGFDRRFKDNESRTNNHQELEAYLGKQFSTRSSSDWLSRFKNANIPCAPVNSIPDVVTDPQIQHRGMITNIPHSVKGSWPVANTPFRFSESDAGARGPSPKLGEHTDLILRNELHLDNQEMQKLLEAGVVEVYNE